MVMRCESLDETLREIKEKAMTLHKFNELADFGLFRAVIHDGPNHQCRRQVEVVDGFFKLGEQAQAIRQGQAAPWVEHLGLFAILSRLGLQVAESHQNLVDCLLAQNKVLKVLVQDGLQSGRSAADALVKHVQRCHQSVDWCIMMCRRQEGQWAERLGGHQELVHSWISRRRHGALGHKRPHEIGASQWITEILVGEPVVGGRSVFEVVCQALESVRARQLSQRSGVCSGAAHVWVE
ncbi:hypothetical protein CLUG_05218 [Clavispora lusitaniae ATCC 42720]|uniref:Uncharacterized protein n=1 Tax=Clavispora lusitaniae (strain ATCC 42720) TaxID=306902 RepID=C4YAJ0_CLAL4|nr:uncharacterized protein CLUG_05218 [Clavispora lusitaniae ATCC 42720]EEQ41089.1 hypothetical protein CLUG_05218 [Clavispora lusitaniae ATCC 42720]